MNFLKIFFNILVWVLYLVALDCSCLSSHLLVETNRLHDHSGHRVGITVAAWPSVLQISIALLSHLSGNPDATAPVSNTGREVVDRRRLVSSSETTLVVLSFFGIICLDMPHVMLGELFNGRLNCLHSSSDPHRLSREVCMSSSSVPVAHHWLGVKSDDHSKVFSDPLQDVPCHPKVISHVYALGGTNLELPLRWHYLSIRARDSDARIETGLVVSFHDVSSVNISSTDSTVVWPLGSWETILGPTKGVAVLAQQGVLLFNAKPGMLVLCFLHNLIASFPVVGLSRLLVVLVRLAHHHDVAAAPERILVHLDRVQVRVRVAALSLIARAPVIIPNREV